MPGEKKAVGQAIEVAEQSAQVKELQNTLEKELVALLSHPLVPQEFKKIFEEQE